MHDVTVKRKCLATQYQAVDSVEFVHDETVLLLRRGDEKIFIPLKRVTEVRVEKHEAEDED